MLKQDEESSEGEILLEICMHEALTGGANIIGFHGSPPCAFFF